MEENPRQRDLHHENDASSSKINISSQKVVMVVVEVAVVVELFLVVVVSNQAVKNKTSDEAFFCWILGTNSP